MPAVYIGVGSNIDRSANIAKALSALQALFGKLLISAIYESDAIGFSGKPFYNLVVAFDTPQVFDNLYDALKKIEQSQGRKKSNNEISIDLDLLLYGNEIDDKRKLPSSDLLERAFVLYPLSEMSPDLKHPVLNECYKNLWDKFPQEKASLKRIAPLPLMTNN